ncbi:MAG: S8 family serine peptidase [Calditrichia bacterium]
MNSKKFFSLILLAMFLAIMSKTATGQVNLQSVGLHQYAQYDGTWFTVVKGEQGDLVDTKHLIVRLKDKADIDSFDFSSANLPRLKNVRGEFADGFYELEIPNELDGFEVARRLEGTGRFDEVIFNVFIKVHANPNDQYYGSQWNLPKVSMPDAWNISKGDTTIIVAVIDVGADYDHEDLAGNCWSGIGYDFYDHDDEPYPSDQARHGTAVAGILGAVTNNSIGIAGVAGGWNGSGGIRIMHLDAGWRDINGNEWIDFSASAQAIDSAAVWGARVINMSFGSGSGYSAWQSAINRAVTSYDVVCIASAGNYQQGQSTSVLYPAAYSNVIAVGATTPGDTRKELNDGTEAWWGSCYGPELDIMAPGVYIYTTDLTGSIGYGSGNYYDSFNGTSSAAPHVAGLAGLIRSINPLLTWQQVRDILRNNAHKVAGMGGQNFHIEYGYGRINSFETLKNTPTWNNVIQNDFYGNTGGNIKYQSTTYLSPYNIPNYYWQQTVSAIDQNNSGTDFIFSHWADGTTMRTRELPLQNNGNYSAVFTGHLRSTSSSATAGNNSRHVMEDPKPFATDIQYHAIYVDNGQVYYTHQPEGTNYWTHEVLVSDPSLQGYTCKTPGIAWYNEAGNEAFPKIHIGIVWEMVDETDYRKIGFREYNVYTDTWSEVITMDWYSNIELKPVITAGYSPTIPEYKFYIMFQEYWEGFGSQILLSNYDHGELTTPNMVIYSQNYLLENVSIISYPDNARLYFCWEKNGHIYYNYYNIQNGEPGLATPYRVSSMGPSSWNQKPNITYKGGDYIDVVWQYWDGSISKLKFHHSRFDAHSPGAETPIYEIAQTGGNLTLPTAGSFVEGSHIAATTQSSAEVYWYMQFFGNGWEPLGTYSGSHAGVNALGEQIMAVSTVTEEGLPYIIDDRLFADEENSIPASRFYRRHVIDLSQLPELGLQGYASLTLSDVKIESKTAGVTTWPFSTTAGAIQSGQFQQTIPLKVTPDMNRLVFKYSLEVWDFKAPAALPVLPLFKLYLKNSTHQIVSNLKQMQFNQISGSQFQVSDSLSINLKPYIEQTLYLNLQDIPFLSAQVSLKRNCIDGKEYDLSGGRDNPAALMNTAKESIAQLPAEFQLYQNYPNPFNPTTTIAFDLPEASDVRLEIFDLNGRRVRTLANSRFAAGTQQVVWDGCEDSGQSVASGVYVVRLRAGAFVQSCKTLLMK